MKGKWYFLLFLLVQMPVMAQNDSINNQSSDTVKSVTDRRGHYIETHLGVGYGSLEYTLYAPNCSTRGGLSGIVQLQYAYFFHKNWGIGAGLWLTNYTSVAQLGGDFTWTKDQNGKPLYDSDMEQGYQHQARISSWREREIIHNIGIPISVQFQHLNAEKKAGVFAAVGVAPAFSVYNRYKVLEGVVEHRGYYPAWDLWLENIHEFQTKDYRNAPEAQGNMRMRMQLAVFADFGALISLSKQTEMYLGAYFNMSATDANPSDKQELGWGDADYAFMNTYKGAYTTTLASAAHPWEAGLKIGIHWHYAAREKKAKKPQEEPVQEPEPVVEPEPMEEIPVETAAEVIAEPEPEPEPVVPVEPEPEPEPQAPKFDKVFFAFDSYELTQEARDYLRSIVPLLLYEVPDYTITLEGHASTDGHPEYNSHLAYNRAKAVSDFLVLQGVDKNRIHIHGYGISRPNEDNTNHLRPLDRRVEIIVEKPAKHQ